MDTWNTTPYSPAKNDVALANLTRRLATFSLSQKPWGACVQRVMAAGLHAVDPAACVTAALKRQGDQLNIRGKTYNLAQFERVLLVGAGKAGAPMALAACDILKERLSAGVIIVKEGHLAQGAVPRNLEIFPAGHPIPDGRGVAASRKLAALLKTAGAEDLVLCLLSGGGSALLASPAPRVSLQDLQTLTGALLACGADINQINSLRKHLEDLKGGSLARLASPARLVTLILSDVVGDPLDVIASGPTAPDPSTFQQAYQTLLDFNILDQVPASILQHLQRGLNADLPETPKPGDPLFERVHNLVIGGNYLAAQAALRQAEREGLNSILLTTWLQGEARQAGRFLAALARQAALSGEPLHRPACLIAGGETTVTLFDGGIPGSLGGRNQELALSAVNDLAGLRDTALVALATDGGDGPTSAAGAVVTGETLARARLLGLDPSEFLQRNDAYHFFEPLGDLLTTGPTLTNVNDLSFIFTF